MQGKSNLVNITLADFIVRTGYQMGKTPLLPIFAATRGAGVPRSGDGGRDLRGGRYRRRMATG